MEGSRLIITLSVAIIVCASLASSDTTADMIDSASGTGLLIDKNCPSHSEFIYNKANVLNSRKSIDWRIKKPYSYEDKDVIIYISSVDEAVLVLDSRYEEIIKKDEIKLEQRRLNAAREIFGSESL